MTLRATLSRNVALSAALLALTSSQVAADALATRDQNPLLAAFGLPSPIGARNAVDGWALSADLNWASTALSQRDANEMLIVDAESRELRLTLERQFAHRWFFQLQLPYRELSGGSLDSFIDNWHDVFGLPEGARPEQPHDRLLIRYREDGVTLFEDTRSQRGLGDTAATFGYALTATERSASRVALSIDLPSGEDDWFLSNDDVDLTALIAAENRFAERWSVYGQAALTWLGEGSLLSDQQKDLAWSAHGAIAWQATRSIELVAQVDAHSAVFDGSDLDFFQEALVLTLGGNIAISPSWSIQLGVSEDIAVEQSPDVVFVLGVRRGGRL